VWIGDDPLAKTPVVTLERETSPDSGEFAPVERRSGRLVQDGDLLLEYTPQPLRRDEDNPQSHYWAVEWQAVPWIGAEDGAGGSLDSLGARAGVSLGQYRFHVRGKDWELSSHAFEVTPADLSVSASRSGSTISATVRLSAPRGYRILDMIEASNQPLPVREGFFAVELTLSAGDPLTFVDVEIAADGTVSVDAGGDAASVTQMTIADAYGNTKTAELN
jgi:hypothetical protein